jgi:deoxycytidylate deaminase
MQSTESLEFTKQQLQSLKVDASFLPFFAEGSNCSRKKVSAILVRMTEQGTQIICTGHSGISGVKKCIEKCKWCRQQTRKTLKPFQQMNNCICEHAEASLFGKLTEEQAKKSEERWAIILPFSPCIECANLLVERKINYVVILAFSKQHPDYIEPIPEYDKSIPFLKKKGIIVVKI